MKWIAKKEVSIGDRRLKSKFLLFPKNINDEVRWFEKATYSQEYTTFCNRDCQWYVWENKEWINDCEHDWVLTDTHCLGMNPPEQIERFTCSKCGKSEIIKSWM